MNLMEISCRKCGGKLSQDGNGKYKCAFCGAAYYEDHLEKEVEMLSGILDAQKQEKLANLKRLLWNELQKEYTDSMEIVSLCKEIKKIYPEDFYANLYEKLNGGNDREICEFIDKIDVQKNYEDVPDVLSFMLKSLTSEQLLSVGNLIERAYGKNRAQYEKYMTEFEEEAEKVEQCLYDPSYPRDVFVMYSSADMEKVMALTEYLEEQNISCFVAARNLQHGKGAVANYQCALETAMDNCKVVVFVSSSNSRSMKCDVIRREMPYIKTQDISGAPAEYRNRYELLPDKYKKPRVEYLIEGYSGKNAIEKITKEFFGTLQWAQTEETVAQRVLEILCSVPETEEKNERIIAELREAEARRQAEIEELRRSFEEQLKQQREEAERKAKEEAERRVKEEAERKAKEEAERETKEENFKIKAAELYKMAELYKIGMTYYIKSEYTQAVKYFSQSAEMGDADAQYSLGVCYEYGQGVSQSYSEAVKWYKKAADQGYADAQCNLGWCYEDGQGVSQSYSEAVKWYKKAADQGYARAQCNLGYCYENGQGVSQSYSEAVKWYKKAADQGYAAAQYILGVCYKYGQGVSQSYSEAVKWYEKAADQGHADAQYNLGECYEIGLGVSQSYSKAVKWYKKAADQGNARAQCNLGVCYENGQGVSQSDSEAVKWYKKAADQGDADAQYNLGECYRYGRGVSENDSEAVKWYEKAADQGHADTQYILGVCYENGQGVSQSDIEAVEWYRKAAEQGHKNAKMALERLKK